MTGSISIDSVSIAFTVERPQKRRKAPTADDVHLEVHQHQLHMWCDEQNLNREIFVFEPSDAAWKRYVSQPLSAAPYLDEILREVTAHHLANRGNPIGTYLEPAVSALDATIAARDGSSVYFAQADDRVKIGWSKKVAARLAQLQTGNATPIQLLGTVPGGRTLERQLHDRFAHLRLSGEWFQAAPELLEHITRRAQ